MGQIFDTCRSRKPSAKIDGDDDLKMEKKFNEELADEESDTSDKAETNE